MALTKKEPLPHAQQKISCVLPAYNEASNLEILIPDLVKEMTSLGHDYEILIVDDGSKDHTIEVLQRFQQQYDIRWMSFSRNFGKEAAITAGLKEARGEAVILMDSDGQHPLSSIKELVGQWQSGADMVVAVRRNRDDELALKRFLTNRFYSLFNKMSEIEIRADAGDFRLMSRAVVDAINLLPEKSRMMKGLYAWVGFQTEYIKFDVADRVDGDSRFGLGHLLSLAAAGLTAFSSLPLRIWMLVGALISGASLAYGGLILLQTLVLGRDVPGWPTITVSVFFLGGIQLLSVGIIGEYIARVFNEVKGRPIYIVQKSSDKPRV